MTEPEPTFHRSIAHPDRRKLLAVAGGCLAVIVSAAVTMGASPGASLGGTGASTAPSSAPDASAEPKHADGGWPDLGGFAFDGPLGFEPLGVDPGDDPGAPLAGFRFGLGIRGGVEITAIDGSSLSLRTEDGWTRTIEVTSSTRITKGGDAISIGDLAVGDHIAFAQKRNDDGTFSITRIAVVLPHVAGTVTATTDSTITIEQRGGTSVTVHVNDSTRFKVEGVNGEAKLSDVKAGMRIVAGGEQRSDGSLDAATVLAGTGKLHPDRLWKGWKNGQGAPDASPGPSESANPG
jgi:hypothetical protein